MVTIKFTMKKKFAFLTIILVAFSNTTVYAQVDNNVSKENFEKDLEEFRSEFNEFREKAVKEYDEYAKAMYAEYMEYVSSIKDMWGEENVAEDTKTEWVEYGKDLKSRSVVDFENGKIDVEILLDNENENDPAIVNQRLTTAIKDLLESRGTTCPYDSKVDKQQPLSQTPILEGIVDFSNYNIQEKIANVDNSSNIIDLKPKKKMPPTPVVKGKTLGTSKNNITANTKSKANEAIENKKKAKLEEERIAAEKKIKELEVEEIEEEKNVTIPAVNTTEQIAEVIAEQSVKSSTTIKGNDNKERTIVKIEMALVSDNLSKNATVYKDYVKQYSQKFNIEQPLIFAVMEQESSFNPKAKSWVPAYGLMQLVPTSGGYDAYRYVYKNDWVPTQSYLYVPHQNIELGTAYLRILMNQFANVTNPDCRRLCVIASYNTGAGNVSRAFTGNTNIKKAIPLINKYSYQQLYQHLTNKLSTDEARKYVSGVSKRREKYLK